MKVFIFLLTFFQEIPAHLLWRAEWAIVYLHNLIYIPFGGLAWFSFISVCWFVLKTCMRWCTSAHLMDPGAHRQVSLVPCKAPCAPLAALVACTPFSAGAHMWFGFARWSLQPDLLSPLFHRIPELLVLPCSFGLSAPIPMPHLCTAVTDRVLQQCSHLLDLDLFFWQKVLLTFTVLLLHVTHWLKSVKFYRGFISW